MSELSASILNKKKGSVIRESAAIACAREVESLESQLATANERAEKAERELAQSLIEGGRHVFTAWAFAGQVQAERDAALRRAQRAEKVVGAVRAEMCIEMPRAVVEALRAFDSDAGENSDSVSAARCEPASTTLPRESGPATTKPRNAIEERANVKQIGADVTAGRDPHYSGGSGEPNPGEAASAIGPPPEPASLTPPSRAELVAILERAASESTWQANDALRFCAQLLRDNCYDEAPDLVAALKAEGEGDG
jgi:hypothetical protein